jgi:hypothetical protein
MLISHFATSLAFWLERRLVFPHLSSLVCFPNYTTRGKYV